VYKDGSFVDPHGFFFSKEGFDKFGGYYDEFNKYRRPQVPKPV
jgi:hypothetical protein